MAKREKRYQKPLMAVAVVLAFIIGTHASPRKHWHYSPELLQQVVPQDDTSRKDTTELQYPIGEGAEKSHPLDLGLGEGYQEVVEYDTATGHYRIYSTYNGTPIGGERLVPVEEYLEEVNERETRDYFQERAAAQNFATGSGLIPELDLGPQVIDDIFNGNFVDIRPQGSAELIFAGDINRVQNPAWPIRQQRTTQFKFDQKLNVSVIGSVGDAIDVGISYNSDATFDFDNQYKLAYEGEEDQIIRKIEAGNVSLPTPGTLIQGSQSLFGIRSELQFGHLRVQTVFSQQKSERKEITLEGGAQKEYFDIPALEYDADRHFFLSTFFRDNYNRWMRSLPIVNSPVIVTRVEVWVTNRSGQYNNTRNIVGLLDLGRPAPYELNEPSITYNPSIRVPSNEANSLYQTLTGNPAFRQNATVSGQLRNLFGVQGTENFSKVDNARQLSPTEFTFHPKLGYVSLSQQLAGDEVLAVSYEYTYNGQRYQVGEFARDFPTDPGSPNVLFVKQLKGETRRVDLHTWDLMMKNIYFLGSYQIQPEDFRLEVVYANDETGANLNYIPEPSEPNLNGLQLLRVLRLDQLNTQQELNPDGRFDYIEGVTVNSSNGRVIFPVLEPFGEFLAEQFRDPTIRDKYIYRELYDSSQFQAEQIAAKNKFFLVGHYQSASGSEISLNAINVPKGSVRVTAGGVELTENVDYTVDYNLGRVRIIDPTILNSGQVITVSAESNDLFSSTRKRLIGTRLDYEVSEDINFGGTLLYLRELPMTRKVNVGSEPISNVIYGFDAAYRTDSRLLTSLVDKIPLIDTKEPSEVLVSWEFAHLLPGHPNAVGEGGVAYLDDFEGSEIPYDLRLGTYWAHSSTPQYQPDLFPRGDLLNDIDYNDYRANISWYTIDQIFLDENSNYMPEHIKNDLEMRSNHFMRQVMMEEIYPQRDLSSAQPRILQTFDIAYFPKERGVYNYTVERLTPDGELQNPEENWGGLMRELETTDFEAANIEYLEFWLMDPFVYDPNAEGGSMYIHLGNISEDILRDGRRSFENGYPKTSTPSNVDLTAWGRVPSQPEVNDAFDNEPSARAYQDVGYDGLRDQDEIDFYNDIYLQDIYNRFGQGSAFATEVAEDPSNDNYQFFRGDELDRVRANIVERYKNYNNPDGNSPVPDPGQEYSNSGKLMPDDEDINGDFTLNEIESYYQYQVKLDPDELVVGQNHVVDKRTVFPSLPNGERGEVTWYQFRVPIRSYDKRVGQIQDFRTIRFLRMAFSGFQDSVIMRFGQFQLVRSEWRRYQFTLDEPGENVPVDDTDPTTFNISTVNLEENAQRTPIPYVLPPGIEREVNLSTAELTEQNEQSLALSVCNLEDGETRAAYKTTTFDVRRYKTLRMFVHAEGENLEDGQLYLFVRLGTDFNNNYYEYAYPLEATDMGSNSPSLIWPTANELAIPLQELYNAKIARNQGRFSLVEPYTVPYVSPQGHQAYITVVGAPDLSDMRTMMIGLRNPTPDNPFNPGPDFGEPICADVWVNELRLTDFIEDGGWAANVRATATLADFGRLSVVGTRKTIGFGGLEQNLQERSLEDELGYDIQAGFQLGKFFPKEARMKIPMLLTYSRTRRRPKYNPLNPDILMETALAEAGEDADSIRFLTEDVVVRKGITFTNVQKLPGPNQENSHFWDIENWNATYIYNHIYRRNINIAFDTLREHKAILAYNYGFKPKPVQPLKGLSKSKFLRPITDFNFYYLPQSMSFRTEFDRRLGTFQYRSLEGVESIITTNFDKSFWNKRAYDLQYNLTRSLRLAYNATADSRIEEPPGYINTEEKRDSLWESITSLGRLMNFTQNVTLSYDLPFSKFPLTDWINLRTSYGATYNWIAAPPAADSLGNTVQNNRTIQANGQLNFVNLYNKIGFLREINQGGGAADRQRNQRLSRLNPEAESEEGTEEEEEEEGPSTASTLGKGLIRALMGARNLSVNYSLSQGTVMPGFQPTPTVLGQDFSANAPGWGFILGSQDTDIRERAAREGWLTTDTNLTALFMNTRTENITGQGLIEPINGLRISLNFSQQRSKNYMTNFRANSFGEFESYTPVESGSFSTTVLALGTTFQGLDNNNRSVTYEEFEDVRLDISERLSRTDEIDPNTGYYVGYSGKSQQVIIPAFLAAYMGKEPGSVSLSPFTKLPAPNWRLSYNGLSRIGFFKSFLNNINITHGYVAKYNVNNYITALAYDPNQGPAVGQDLPAQLQIQQISLREELAPLIGVDVGFKNQITARAEYRKSRTMAFTFSNYQLTEMREDNIIIGIGYRTRELVLPFRVNGRKAVLDNDINFRFDLSYRDNKTLVRRLDEELSTNPGVAANPTATAGIKTLSIDPTIEYIINKNLTLRIFAKREITTPMISTSFPRKYTNFGFSLRYNLGQ